ncbi:MAG: HlyD family efflux transporter periplasmic adaptor subunit [Clostridia bacterium]|nr:HlyD family efflux transporter periplasmic adaptor subunit [Clostridia bacterium]
MKNIITKIFSVIREFPKEFKSYSKKKKLIIIISAAILIALLVSLIISAGNKKGFVVSWTEETVKRQDITSSITGSAVVMPKDQYSITALVSGNVLSANFEQGEVVNEGDVLYEIDSSDAKNSIENADISYQRSQMDYQKAADNYSNLTVVSDISGVVKTLYVKEGMSVNSGTKIADIHDDSSFILTVTFNDTDARDFYIGQEAQVKITSNGELLRGTITDVNSRGYASTGNTLVRTVKIKVTNPGALTTEETASAIVNGFASNPMGTFEYIAEKTIVAEASGQIDAMYVSQGSRVSNGSVLVHIDSSSVVDSLKSSELSLRSSQLSRENAQKKLEDYTITAPISGTVVTKNVKAGDKLDNSNMSTEMAVIYDMSSLECELAVDELDIKSVELDQDVIITSDAVKGKTYNGKVTNVSVNGTTSGGVTTYPVTILITDFDEELLPGMNIDVEIITSMAKEVIAIPVAAVSRGNIVYVKGEKTSDDDDAPEGYKSVVVETGINNTQYIEIISGLQEGDIVYIPQIIASQSKDSSAPMMGGMGGMGGGMSGGGMPGGMPSGMPGGSMGGNRSGGGMPGGMPSGMR